MSCARCCWRRTILWMADILPRWFVRCSPSTHETPTPMPKIDYRSTASTSRSEISWRRGLLPMVCPANTTSESFRSHVCTRCFGHRMSLVALGSTCRISFNHYEKPHYTRHGILSCTTSSVTWVGLTPSITRRRWTYPFSRSHRGHGRLFKTHRTIITFITSTRTFAPWTSFALDEGSPLSRCVHTVASLAPMNIFLGHTSVPTAFVMVLIYATTVWCSTCTISRRLDCTFHR